MDHAVVGTSQSLVFRWEVFNVTNSVRFDVQPSRQALIPRVHLATTRVADQPAVMQFALRYEF